MAAKDKPGKRRTARRGNGEGSIFQRADGRWVATVTIGYDANGKRQRRTVYAATKAAVQEKLAGLHVQSLQGTPPAVDKITLAEHLDRWLEHTAKPNYRAATYALYESTIRVHIKPLVGGLKLTKLTPNNIRALYDRATKNGTTANTLRHVHAILYKVLKQAVRDGILSRNACEAVTPPRIKKAEIQPFDAAEAQDLLDISKGTRNHALFAVAIGCGLRLGELLALGWDDIDLENATLSVRYTREDVLGVLDRKEPKTATSRRKIDLPAFVVDALWKHKAILLAEGLAGHFLVFPSKRGVYQRRTNFHQSEWLPTLEAAGLRRIRFHDLRHTSATLLLVQGVNPKVVQERLGHSKVNITLDTYSHVMPGLQKEAASKLDSLFPKTG